MKTNNLCGICNNLLVGGPYLVQLSERNYSGDNSISMPNCNGKVFDVREEGTFEEFSPVYNPKTLIGACSDIWYMTEPYDLSLIYDSKESWVVSGRLRDYFTSKWDERSYEDDIYVATVVGEKSIKWSVKGLLDRKAKDIIVGRRVVIRKTVDFLRRLRDERILSFLSLPTEKQIDILRRQRSF